jgi:hypothetical protein
VEGSVNYGKPSRRQELADLVGTGRLRDAGMDARLSEEACNLLVDIVARYCEPRRTRRRTKRLAIGTKS